MMDIDDEVDFLLIGLDSLIESYTYLGFGGTGVVQEHGLDRVAAKDDILELIRKVQRHTLLDAADAYVEYKEAAANDLAMEHVEVPNLEPDAWIRRYSEKFTF